ncbi:TPA: hypothetical protein ACGUOR_002608 [Vibrio vulnificus]
MFYFKLFENTKLAEFSVSDKNKIINIAIKQSRKDFPLNIRKRLLILFGIVFLPSTILYLAFSLNGSIAWFILATMVLNLKMASMETPTIEHYLDRAIAEFINQT